MSRREKARWVALHAIYHFGRLVTYVLFVLLDRPTKKPRR